MDGQLITFDFFFTFSICPKETIKLHELSIWSIQYVESFRNHIRGHRRTPSAVTIAFSCKDAVLAQWAVKMAFLTVSFRFSPYMTNFDRHHVDSEIWVSESCTGAWVVQTRTWFVFFLCGWFEVKIATSSSLSQASSIGINGAIWPSKFKKFTRVVRTQITPHLRSRHSERLDSVFVSPTRL